MFQAYCWILEGLYECEYKIEIKINEINKYK